MAIKNWVIPITTLIVYLIGIAYTFVSGNELSTNEITVLQGLIAVFIGSSGIGAYVSIANKKIKNV